MKDLKIGTKITLEIVEGDTCKDCFFQYTCSYDECEKLLMDKCYGPLRTDGKNIIFKEVKS